MKKILLILCLSFTLFSCSKANDKYIRVSDNLVDGYYIYEYDYNDFFCRTEYTDIYYSDETYNYGFSFMGCNPSVTFFILKDGQYVYIEEALDSGYITIESLLPFLEQFEREPEEIESDNADYYWLDFHIGGDVVYAYAGGVCDQAGSESFTINGKNYVYQASGCLKEHILFMEVNHEYVPIAELIENETIDGMYLIPLLTEVD